VTGRRGWWRRNLWGLVLLPVAAAAALYPGLRDMYETYWQRQPHVALPVDAAGWAALDGARMRLVELIAVDEVPSGFGPPTRAPARTRVWRSTVEFAGDPTAVEGCTIALEDRDGTTYGANPTELGSLLIAGCTPPDGTAPTARSYQVVAYFLLPQARAPAAVRVSVPTQLPRYVRLPAPG